VEAVLSGLIDARALLDRLLNHAAFEGGSYCPLDRCLGGEVSAPARFAAAPRVKLPWPVTNGTESGAHVLLTASGAWPEQSAMISAGSSGAAITTGVGVVGVDIATGGTTWAVPLSGCRGAAVVAADGSVAVVCGQAVIRWQDGAADVLAGGFTGNSQLLSGADGALWVFDNTGERYASQLTLTRLGDRVGQEVRYEIGFNADVWCAAWLGDQRFFLSASGHSAVVDLALAVPVTGETGVGYMATVDEQDWIKMPHPAPRFAVPLGDREVATCSDSGSGMRSTVFVTDVKSRASTPLAELNVNRTFGMYRSGDGRLHVLADVRGNDLEPRPIVVELDPAHASQR
jgi:hypothetical protein